ncbi:fibronectin type III domain-containing protein, partial [Cellulomonas sp. HZM]|uniref:fibronectin type III domain-containing protein n=1 Tax=Cellulomonas sp. HZM TaxID=1454010 RepID=UPI000493761B
MKLLPQLHRRLRLAAAFGVVGFLTVGLPVAQATQAEAATVQWVDGGDDQPCLQDDMGAALTSLAEDKFCQPIPTCHEYDGNNPKYKGRIVQSSASTGIWQGDPNDVLYEDDLPSDYNITTSQPTKTPTPSTPTPTKSPTGTATKPATSGGSSGSGSSGSGGSSGGSSSGGSKGSSGSTKGSTGSTSSGNGGKGSTASGSSGSGSSGTTKGTTGTTGTTTTTTTATGATDDLGIDPDEKAVEGAPSAPGTPRLTVDGSTIVVEWDPSPDVDLDAVTGYVVQLSGDNHAEVDASTTRHEFRDLPDGSYRAAVRAVNEVGQSEASTPSEPVTVGTPVTSFVGALTWTGDVSPGATVTLTGSGYAPGVELAVELHSDPVLLTTVTTDAQGSFSTDVVVPADAPEGEHHLVVAYQGTVVSETPVTLVAAAPAPAASAEPVAAAAAETVPPLTGLVILVALAVAGVLLLASHYARGGARRARRAAAPATTPHPSAAVPLPT